MCNCGLLLKVETNYYCQINWQNWCCLKSKYYHLLISAAYGDICEIEEIQTRNFPLFL